MMESVSIVTVLVLLTASAPSKATEPVQIVAPAEGTNAAFSHTLETTARVDAIWRLWTDVSSWKNWDKGLKDAELSGPMALGSKGRIIPLSGAPAEFEITAFEPNRSYTLTMNFPDARLMVRRFIVGKSPTVFRHDIRFEGPQAERWANLLGPGFRAALPPTMTELSRLATSATSPR